MRILMILGVIYFIVNIFNIAESILASIMGDVDGFSIKIIREYWNSSRIIGKLFILILCVFCFPVELIGTILGYFIGIIIRFIIISFDKECSWNSLVNFILLKEYTE